MMHEIGVLEFLGAALAISGGFRFGQHALTVTGAVLICLGAFQLWMGA